MPQYKNSECDAHRNVKTSVPVCIVCMDQEIERLRAALSWVLGEEPDSNGKWFEPDNDEPRRPDGNPIARYWWRGNLRRMIAQIASDENDK